MNDRIVLAVRHLATDESDVRKRVAIAASTLDRIHNKELHPECFALVDEIVKEAQRYPAIRDTQGNVIVSAFNETARRSTKKFAKKISLQIWALYHDAKERQS